MVATFALRHRRRLPFMNMRDEYRQYAEACLVMAQTAADEVARATLIQMARVWHRLADAHAAESTSAERKLST